MNIDASTIKIIFSALGIFNILLGRLMIKYQLVDIISVFNSNKYDKEKTSEIYGANLILMGLLMILVTIVYSILSSLGIKPYIIIIAAIVLITTVKIIYRTLRYAKK